MKICSPFIFIWGLFCRRDGNRQANKMEVRKVTDKEMLNLWGYKKLNSLPPTALFFVQNISSGNAGLWQPKIWVICYADNPNLRFLSGADLMLTNKTSRRFPHLVRIIWKKCLG